MNKLNISVIAFAVGLAFSVDTMAEDTPSEDMSKEQYDFLEKNIKAEYRSAKVRCNSLSLNANDVCVTEAKGKKNVAEAELEADYKPSAKTQYNARVAKTDADYDVAREKCEGLNGAFRSMCRNEAKVSFNQ